MSLKFEKPESRFKIEDEWTSILGYFALTLGIWALSFMIISSTNDDFDPTNYITKKAVLKYPPKKYSDNDGSYISVDNVRNVVIRINNYPFFENGFLAEEFMREVGAGDTIWYSIRRSNNAFSGPTTIQAIGTNGKTYMELNHLAKYDKWYYKVFISLFGVALAITPFDLVRRRFFNTRRSNGNYILQLKS